MSRTINRILDTSVSRRAALHSAAGILGGAILPGGLILPARAADNPPLGTYPEGSSGPSVFVGISVPRTGTYAAAGEDLIKGYQLAIEHLNEGNALMQKISPNIKKGVLGKEVKFGIADSEAKPNTAVQNISKFISDNKAVMVTGSVSSAEAVADNKIADREKVIYLAGISGSNDTTGKDCVRYSFRECFYGQTAAKAIAPQLIKTVGKNKKVAYLTPDYTYGHTVQKSMEEYLKEGGWTTATDQVSPLGTTEFSSYLLNVANSGADVVVNINFGRDAVLSIKQAKQFGVLDKMVLAVPYNTPFLAKEVGADTMQGVLAATDYWWTLEDKFPLAKDVQRRLPRQILEPPGVGRQRSPTCRWRCGRMRSSGPSPSTRRMSSRPMRPARRSSRRSARFISAAPTISWCGRSSSSAEKSRRI